VKHRQSGAPPADRLNTADMSRRVIQTAVPLVLIVGIVVVATVLLSSGHSKTKLPGGVHRTSASKGLVGGVVSPVKPAPPIALDDYLGRPVTLSQYRGKVLLVTFLYTHCPDVCPLIASNLKLVLARLGTAAKQVQAIAVSVDPRGDTPGNVAAFLKARGMTGKMEYLVGSPAQLGRVWSAWNVGSQRDASNPALVAHSALVYGITASGKLKTLYSANFNPAEIVHDVPVLAES
jgi:protein SCO1/2